MRLVQVVILAALGLGLVVAQSSNPFLAPNNPVVQIGDTIRIPQSIQNPEGPIWLGDRWLVADSRGGFIWEFKDGFRRPLTNTPGIPAGHAFLPDGSMARTLGVGQVVRVDKDGLKTLEVLAQEYEGKIFNGPNDLVVDSKGAIYFTDPIWGLRGRRSALGFEGVYRIDPDKKVTLLTKEVAYPNGIALSPDEKTLYVNDYSNAPDFVGTMLAFDIQPNGTLTNRRAFGPKGSAGDGLKTDKDGNVWAGGAAAAGGDILILNPKGEQMGVIPVPGNVVNFAWGGKEGKTLLAGSSDGIYLIETTTTSGLKFGPK